MNAEGEPLDVAGGGESGDHHPSGHPYPHAVARSGHYTQIHSASQLTLVSLFFSVIRTRLTDHKEVKQPYECQMIVCKKSNDNSIALGGRPVVGVPANGVRDSPTQIPSNPP